MKGTAGSVVKSSQMKIGVHRSVGTTARICSFYKKLKGELSRVEINPSLYKKMSFQGGVENESFDSGRKARGRDKTS